MGIANVAGLHLSWQFAWRFKYQSVIEHLDLYLSSFDIVGSVATGINHHLLYDEFWIVTTGYKLSVLSQEGVLTYLGLDELYRFPDLVQDGSFKDDILDVEADEKLLGKSTGKDQRDDKPTFVTLLGLDAAKEKLSEEENACYEILDYLNTLKMDIILLRELTDFNLKREY